MIVSWFSAGVSSFVATWLLRDRIDKILYIHIDDQHPDSLRFVAEAQALLSMGIEVLQSDYGSVSAVIKHRRFIKSAFGAQCTEKLKKVVRKEWEYTHDKEGPFTYVWGYDLDESHRKDRLVEAMPNQTHLFPLIDAGMTKADAHGLCKKLGLARPAMYTLGYNNNNCIGCVKGGMGYWNKIRVDFPETFQHMALVEREIGHSCLKDCFLDELDPARGRATDEVMEDCGIACQLQLT